MPVGSTRPSRRTGREVQRLCREHDVLLIADEVITGFGRTGVLWGSQRFGIEPDMVIFAKVVTSGYQPLGGVLVGAARRCAVLGRRGGRPDVPARLHVLAATRRRAPRPRPTSTSSRARASSPASRSTRRRSPRRSAGLEALPLVGEVRTVGLTAAVAIDPARLAADAGIPARVVGAALRHGVATRVLRGHAIQISPAFTITLDEVDTMVDGLGAALEDVAAS